MIRVQSEDFDPGEEIARLHHGRSDIGAVVSFVGLVRGESHGERLTSMTLEHFPGMTERELERIAEEALSRWCLQGVSVVHRVGELKPGERIVLVVTAATHRQAAFDAGNFLMDYLKTRAPFWKRELRASGEYWVEARDSDDEAAARWRR
ncbi:MAG: molybdopterin synthase catalytic subunit MoaE [Alphaproteobacteria bacterium]|nr:molybdopterin synthase catalytic subunit MoaE [Alphaproteobacteria bacterium]